jgi:hypothetical protein
VKGFGSKRGQTNRKILLVTLSAAEHLLNNLQKSTDQMVDIWQSCRVFFGAIQKDNYFGFASGPMQDQWRCSELRSF